MIILAAGVVITLNNTGVIDRASQAIDLTNEASVQDLAALVWAEAYIDGKRGNELETTVKTELFAQGIKETDWNMDITDTGIKVTNKNPSSGSELGLLITSDNYGDTVDYSVTVDGTTYDNWQIYYHNEEYVYLILAGKLPTDITLKNGITVASLTTDELTLYEKFRVGNENKYTLTDTVSGGTAYNSQAIAQLIKDYANFANITDYGENVIGAIGGPTIELLAAGWSAKEYTPTISLTTSIYGYKINNAYHIDVTNDELYVPSDYIYWLASPSASNAHTVILSGSDCVSTSLCSKTVSVRPVICLKASIPAKVGTTTSFTLVK